MKECASTMREAENLVAFANHNILVNAVKLIDVIFTNAKIMDLVLLLLSTTFPHQNANAKEILVEQLVTLTCAQILNVATELVLGEPVNVMKVTSMMVTSAKTFVTVSIVELAVTVHKEFVTVVKVLQMLKTSVMKLVH